MNLSTNDDVEKLPPSTNIDEYTSRATEDDMPEETTEISISVKIPTNLYLMDKSTKKIQAPETKEESLETSKMYKSDVITNLETLEQKTEFLTTEFSKMSDKEETLETFIEQEELTNVSELLKNTSLVTNSIEIVERTLTTQNTQSDNNETKESVKLELTSEIGLEVETSTAVPVVSPKKYPEELPQTSESNEHFLTNQDLKNISSFSDIQTTEYDESGKSGLTSEISATTLSTKFDKSTTTAHIKKFSGLESIITTELLEEDSSTKSKHEDLQTTKFNNNTFTNPDINYLSKVPNTTVTNEFTRKEEDTEITDLNVVSTSKNTIDQFRKLTKTTDTTNLEQINENLEYLCNPCPNGKIKVRPKAVATISATEFSVKASTYKESIEDKHKPKSSDSNDISFLCDPCPSRIKKVKIKNKILRPSVQATTTYLNEEQKIINIDIQDLIFLCDPCPNPAFKKRTKSITKITSLKKTNSIKLTTILLQESKPDTELTISSEKIAEIQNPEEITKKLTKPQNETVHYSLLPIKLIGEEDLKQITEGIDNTFRTKIKNVLKSKAYKIIAATAQESISESTKIFNEQRSKSLTTEILSHLDNVTLDEDNLKHIFEGQTFVNIEIPPLEPSTLGLTMKITSDISQKINIEEKEIVNNIEGQKSASTSTPIITNNSREIKTIISKPETESESEETESYDQTEKTTEEGNKMSSETDESISRETKQNISKDIKQDVSTVKTELEEPNKKVEETKYNILETSNNKEVTLTKTKLTPEIKNPELEKSTSFRTYLGNTSLYDTSNVNTKNEAETWFEKSKSAKEKLKNINEGAKLMLTTEIPVQIKSNFKNIGFETYSTKYKKGATRKYADWYSEYPEEEEEDAPIGEDQEMNTGTANDKRNKISNNAMQPGDDQESIKTNQFTTIKSITESLKATSEISKYSKTETVTRKIDTGKNNEDTDIINSESPEIAKSLGGLAIENSFNTNTNRDNIVETSQQLATTIPEEEEEAGPIVEEQQPNEGTANGMKNKISNTRMQSGDDQESIKTNQFSTIKSITENLKATSEISKFSKTETVPTKIDTEKNNEDTDIINSESPEIAESLSDSTIKNSFNTNRDNVVETSPMLATTIESITTSRGAVELITEKEINESEKARSHTPQHSEKQNNSEARKDETILNYITTQRPELSKNMLQFNYHTETGRGKTTKNIGTYVINKDINLEKNITTSSFVTEESEPVIGLHDILTSREGNSDEMHSKRPTNLDIFYGTREGETVKTQISSVANEEQVKHSNVYQTLLSTEMETKEAEDASQNPEISETLRYRGHGTETIGDNGNTTELITTVSEKKLNIPFNELSTSDVTLTQENINAKSEEVAELENTIANVFISYATTESARQQNSTLISPYEKSNKAYKIFEGATKYNTENISSEKYTNEAKYGITKNYTAIESKLFSPLPILLSKEDLEHLFEGLNLKQFIEQMPTEHAYYLNTPLDVHSYKTMPYSKGAIKKNNEIFDNYPVDEGEINTNNREHKYLSDLLTKDIGLQSARPVETSDFFTRKETFHNISTDTEQFSNTKIMKIAGTTSLKGFSEESYISENILNKISSQDGETIKFNIFSASESEEIGTETLNTKKEENYEAEGTLKITNISEVTTTPYKYALDTRESKSTESTKEYGKITAGLEISKTTATEPVPEMDTESTLCELCDSEKTNTTQRKNKMSGDSNKFSTTASAVTTPEASNVDSEVTNDEASAEESLTTTLEASNAESMATTIAASSLESETTIVEASSEENQATTLEDNLTTTLEPSDAESMTTTIAANSLESETTIVETSSTENPATTLDANNVESESTIQEDSATESLSSNAEDESTIPETTTSVDANSAESMVTTTEANNEENETTIVDDSGSENPATTLEANNEEVESTIQEPSATGSLASTLEASDAEDESTIAEPNTSLEARVSTNEATGLGESSQDESQGVSEKEAGKSITPEVGNEESDESSNAESTSETFNVTKNENSNKESTTTEETDSHEEEDTPTIEGESENVSSEKEEGATESQQVDNSTINENKESMASSNESDETTSSEAVIKESGESNSEEYDTSSIKLGSTENISESTEEGSSNILNISTNEADKTIGSSGDTQESNVDNKDSIETTILENDTDKLNTTQISSTYELGGNGEKTETSKTEGESTELVTSEKEVISTASSKEETENSVMGSEELRSTGKVSETTILESGNSEASEESTKTSTHKSKVESDTYTEVASATSITMGNKELISNVEISEPHKNTIIQSSITKMEETSMPKKHKQGTTQNLELTSTIQIDVGMVDFQSTPCKYCHTTKEGHMAKAKISTENTETTSATSEKLETEKKITQLTTERTTLQEKTTFEENTSQEENKKAEITAKKEEDKITENNEQEKEKTEDDEEGPEEGEDEETDKKEQTGEEGNKEETDTENGATLLPLPEKETIKHEEETTTENEKVEEKEENKEKETKVEKEEEATKGNIEETHKEEEKEQVEKEEEATKENIEETQKEEEKEQVEKEEEATKGNIEETQKEEEKEQVEKEEEATKENIEETQKKEEKEQEEENEENKEQEEEKKDKTDKENETEEQENTSLKKELSVIETQESVITAGMADTTISKKVLSKPIVIIINNSGDKLHKLNQSVLEGIISTPINDVDLHYIDMNVGEIENSNMNTKNQPLKLNVPYEPCPKADYLNGQNCFCNIQIYMDLLLQKINNKGSIKSKKNYCESFLKLKSGLLIQNSIKPIERKRRGLIYLENLKKKGETVEYETIDGLFEDEYQLNTSSVNLFCLPGEVVKIGCTTHRDEKGISWKFRPLSSAKDQLLLDKGGELVIHGVSAKNTGNYTCSKEDENSILENQHWHELEMITFPVYDINMNIFYKFNDSCSLRTGDILYTYLPKIVGPLLCSNENDLCSVDVKRPRCLTRADDNYFNVTMIAKISSDFISTLHDKCDINCKLRIYENLVTVIYKNTEILEHVPVYSMLEPSRKLEFFPNINGKEGSPVTVKRPKIIVSCPNGFGLESKHQSVCVACPPHTFSGDDEAFCKTCPAGKYQPDPGSKSCIQCNSPVDNEMCLRMLYTDTKLFKIYVGVAFGFIVLMVIIVLVWTSGHKDDDNSQTKSSYFEGSLRHRAMKKKDPDIETGVRQPLLGRSPRRPTPPRLPPVDF